MTEPQLLHSILTGVIENEVGKYITKETMDEAGVQHDCPAVRAVAWRRYVESMKDVPAPVSFKI